MFSNCARHELETFKKMALENNKSNPNNGDSVAEIEQNAQYQRILIGRHGKPALSRKVWLSAEGYRQWWRAYDEGGLAEKQKIPRKLLNSVAKIDKIIASPLPRALETAKALAGDKPIETNEIFVEAPLPPPPIPSFIKFRPKIWGFVARCTWYVGMHDGLESHEEAKLRASAAADFLDEQATTHKSLAVFAHGWFNRMMRPYLIAKGYECIEDGGDGHWSYRVYQKRISQEITAQ